MTREEFIDWFENSKLPLKLGVTMLHENIIVIRRVSEQQKIVESEAEALKQFFKDEFGWG